MTFKAKNTVVRGKVKVVPMLNYHAMKMCGGVEV